MAVFVERNLAHQNTFRHKSTAEASRAKILPFKLIFDLLLCIGHFEF